MLNISKKQIKEILKYVFSIAIVCRILVSIYMGYQYVRFSSTHINTKWWTFVEWIFGSTSYLPYLRNDTQSLFYQWLLFNSCVRHQQVNWEDEFIPDLCNVSTQDDKIYYISLAQWFIWSDGTPVSTEDIFFTYDEILRQNKWDIPWWKTYKDIKITKETNNKLKVVFSSASPDNILLFTNYILPRHSLANFDVDQYKNFFSTRPIYTNCANLVAQTTDEYSLIFNLVNCEDTKLNFYQIKNAISFDKFRGSINDGGDSIIDAYIGPEIISGYIQEHLMTNNLVTIFLNTNSPILRVRTRRVLWWLIKHNFYSSLWYKKFMEKNSDGLFDVFQSTGAKIKDFLNRDYSEWSITKEDLMDINIKPLTKSLNVSERNKKMTFYMDLSWDNLDIEVNFDKYYDKVLLEYKGKSYSFRNYNSKTQKAEYSIGTKYNNLGTGLNKYLIYGREKKSKKLITSIDVYNMIKSDQDDSSTQWPKNKLTVIYFNGPIYTMIVDKLKEIFTKSDVSENFVFQQIDTAEELQWRLIVWDYDLLISTIDVGIKNDLKNLFSTQKAEINPSQYQNIRLASLMEQYANSSSKSKLLWEINSIYSKDMPFVVLWKAYTIINVKPKIAAQLFQSWINLYEYNRRNYVYKNLSLIQNIHIDGKVIWNSDNFANFIKQNLGTKKKSINTGDAQFLELSWSGDDN